MSVSVGSRTAMLLAIGMAVGAGPMRSSFAADTISAAEAGARFGQATAAAKLCPAGIITDKGRALPESYSGADAETFKTEADKVVDAWTKASVCNELEMDSRELASCRTAKVRTCRAAWAEIGPEGTAIPGLIDVKYDQ